MNLKNPKVLIISIVAFTILVLFKEYITNQSKKKPKEKTQIEEKIDKIKKKKVVSSSSKEFDENMGKDEEK